MGLDTFNDGESGSSCRTKINAGLDRAGSAADATSSVVAATYTPVLSDAGKVIPINHPAGCTFTVPPDSSVAFPNGTMIYVTQDGAGRVTFAPGAGVTINFFFSRNKTQALNATAILIKKSTNIWNLTGDVNT